MSQLPSDVLADELLRQTRQRRTDSEVSRKRAATLPSDAENRSVKRLSIAELNDANADQLPTMLAKARFDNRPTVVKALDLIDVSRNTMANIAAGQPTVGGVAGTLAETTGAGAGIGLIFGGVPGAALGAAGGLATAGVMAGVAGLSRAFTSPESRKRLTKNEKGFGGQARIDGADILREMGVENRVVRAVAGFAGDMAFDPLTFVGPPGFGVTARVAQPGARGIAEASWRMGVRKAVKGSAKAASRGEAIKDDLMREGLARVGYSPAKIAELRAAGKSAKEIQAEISSAMFGATEGGMFSRGLEAVGADQRRSGGAISRYFYDQDLPDDQALTLLRSRGAKLDTPDEIAAELGKYRSEAAIGEWSRRLYQKYGKGTRTLKRVGLKPGETGSEYLHIPFTDISLLQGPSISKGAKSSATLMAAARGLGPVASMAPEIAEGARLADELVRGAMEARDLHLQTNENIAQGLRGADEADALGDYAGGQSLRDRAQATRDAHRDRTAAAIARIDADAERVGQIIKGAEIKSIEDAVMLGRVREMATAAARRSRAIIAEADSFDELAKADKAMLEIGESANRAMRNIDELATLQEDGGRAFLGGVDATPTVHADPNVRHSVSERIADILPALRAARSEAVEAQRGAEAAGVRNTGLFDPGSVRQPGELSGAQQRLAALRDELYDATAPLRDGPQVSLDEARAAIIDNEKSLTNDNIRRMLAMSEDERSSLRRALDTRIASIEAALDLAAAVDAPFASIASSSERALAEFAATELGTNDLTTGASALSSIGKALRRANDKGAVPERIVDSMDRGVRDVFGRRSGEQNLQRRMFEASSGPAAQAAFAEAADGFVRRITKAAKEFDVPRDQRPELFSVGLALAISRLEKADQAFHSGVIVGKGTRVRVVPVADYLADPSKYPDAHETFHVLLERSRRDGLLANEKLAAEMASIADDAEPLLKELGRHAVEADLLGIAIEAYMPLVVTKRGRELLRTMKGRGAGNALSASESFQHARSTEQYLFRAADGEFRRFFEWQRNSIGKWSDGEIAAAAGGDSAAEAAFREIRDAVQEYERLPNKTKPMHTDPFELNSLIRDGMFSVLTGRGLGKDEGFFSTNLAEVIGARAAQQQRAYARRQFQRYAAESGLGVKTQKLEEWRNQPGAKVALPNGTEITMLPPIKGRPAFRLGTHNYRLLNQPADGVRNPLWDTLGDARLGDMAFEENLADMIERAAGQYDPQNVGEMLRAWDKFISVWRTVTLLHPSWMVNDTFGNILLWLSGGLPAHRALSMLPAAWRMLGSDDSARGVTMNLNDGRRLGHQAMEEAMESGAIGVNQVSETAAYLVNGDLLSLNDIFEKPLRTPGERIARLQAWPREALEAIKRPGALPKKFSEGAMRQVVSPWFRFNHRINTAMRLAMFGALIEQGNDAATAARMIRESMYDFTDMTKFESRTLRRIIPFASWVRSNMGRQIALLGERPAVAATYPKVFRAIEEAVNGEDTVPEDQRPAWLRDQLAVQFGKDPDNRFALLLRSVAPVGDAYEAIAPLTGPEGFMDFMRYFGSNLAPGLRSVGELAAGKEFFSGREIGPDATQGDIGLGEYALSQFRPLREFGVGASRTAPIARAFEQGVGPGLSRTVLGGRSQAFDSDRLSSSLLRDFQDRERGLRIAINRAERYGRGSEGERGKLMALYRRMQEVGLGDEVPKWAREQMEGVSGP